MTPVPVRHELSEVPPDAFTVFLSYSADDDYGDAVRTFKDDLAVRFGKMTGARRGVGFQFWAFGDWANQGSDFRPEIDEKLNPADVLMPLFSPYYFSSVWCARELGAFKERLAANQAGLASDNFVPVRWLPEDVPPHLRSFRVGWEGESSYRAAGLCVLQEDDKDAYRRVVANLAGQLAAIWRANRARTPPGASRVAVAVPGFRPRNEAPATRGRRFHLMPGSVSLRELNSLENGSASSGAVPARDCRNYYGSEPADWDPFRPDGLSLTDSQVVEAIEDGAWYLRMRTAAAGPQALTSHWRDRLLRELPENPVSLSDDPVVVAYIDTWLLHFPNWRDRFKNFAGRRPHPTLVLVPKPSDEQFATQWDCALERALDETLDSPERDGGMIIRQSGSVEEFRDVVVNALEELCAGGVPRLRT